MSAEMVKSSSLGASPSNKELATHKPTTVDKHSPSTYPRWHSAVAGATAGGAARIVTAPLDLLRIRRQLAAPTSQQKPESIVSSLLRIARSEGGIPSLFRGNVAATYLWIGYSAVQFSLYTSTRDFLTMSDSNLTVIQALGSHDMAVSFVSGATAGVGATIATYPFDICRTIFAAQGVRTDSSFRPPKSIYEFALNMHRTQGIRGFFAGSTPAVIQIIPYMGLNFLIHDELMNRWHKHGFGSSGLAGIVSGGVSKLLIYPLDTVKKRLQAQAAFISGTNYKGTLDCLITMAREEGVRSLYNGLAPSVLKNMVGTGLSFACFTFTKDTLEALHDRRSTQS